MCVCVDIVSEGQGTRGSIGGCNLGFSWGKRTGKGGNVKKQIETVWSKVTVSAHFWVRERDSEPLMFDHYLYEIQLILHCKKSPTRHKQKCL